MARDRNSTPAIVRGAALALALLALAAANALAVTITVDGDPSDWGVAPGVWGSSDWTPFAGVQGTWPPAEDDFPDNAGGGQVGPGFGGQEFDAEALYFAVSGGNACFGIVTGMPPGGARGERPGDIILAFGLGSDWTHAIETTGDGGLALGGLYAVTEWDDGLWGAVTNPSGIAAGSPLWTPLGSNLCYEPTTGNHFFIEVAVPLSVLPLSEAEPTPFRAHWTETCGNDAVDLEGLLPDDPHEPEVPPVMPEPTTLALLGCAVAGLAARRRRR